MAITDSTINSLEFQSKLTGELDKALVQEAQTSFFADNALRSKFVGARTVLIPDVDMEGLGNYDRDDGFVTGALTVSSESYTMAMDRGRSFQLDREDNDETGIANLAGQVMGEFVRTRVVPELDAYVLSKLATLATTKSQTVTGTVASQIYKMITEAINKVQAVAGYSEPLVCFVDSTVWAALMNTTEVTRQINVGEFKKGAINTKVKYLNDVPIIPVSDDRMKTAYTFYDGVTNADSVDQTVGGFVPATSAKKIGILVLPRRAASLVKKSERIRTFTPEQNQKADAYLFQYRIYYDLFVKKSLTGTVYTYTY
jgi:hypothetical protein